MREAGRTPPPRYSLSSNCTAECRGVGATATQCLQECLQGSLRGASARGLPGRAFPMRKVKRFRSIRSASGRSHCSRMNILLVDDSKAMRVMVRRALQETGMCDLCVEEAENGSDALAKLAVGLPDLILS